MAISFQLERFRREAKKLCRISSITHSEALDRIAVQQGFTNWSLLVKHSDAVPANIRTKPASASRNARHRHYLHGDVVDGEPGKCYCARCDQFCDLSHLQPTSWHEDGKDGERFLSSLASLPPLKRARYRPADAPNVLQHAAEATLAVREASRSPFHIWLERQRDRNDVVGDLASDVLSDKHFPLGVTSRREVEDYLSKYGSHVISAVQQAWREFQGPTTKTLAQALAEALDISEAEAEELVDVELTGHSGEMTYSYLFDFTKHASPKLSTKLLKKRGSLKLEVGSWFYDSVDSQGF